MTCKHLRIHRYVDLEDGSMNYTDSNHAFCLHRWPPPCLICWASAKLRLTMALVGRICPPNNATHGRTTRPRRDIGTNRGRTAPLTRELFNAIRMLGACRPRHAPPQ
jgi:hypothetical protein